MQNKLLYSSALCALFSVSGMLLGMKEPNVVHLYTYLTLSTPESFIAIPQSNLNEIVTDSDNSKFNKNWKKVGCKEFNEKIGSKSKPLDSKIYTSPDNSLLIIEDNPNAEWSNISVLVNNKLKITFDSCRTSTVEQFKKHCADNKPELSFFIIGDYYPISAIIHNREILMVESETMAQDRQATRDVLNTIKHNTAIIENVESIIEQNIRTILLCGAGVVGLLCLFKSFKSA